MTHDRRGNGEPNGNETGASGGSGVGRRGFLTMTGAAAAALGGVFSGSASAAQTDVTVASDTGYGAQSYGTLGYGGGETSN